MKATRYAFTTQTAIHEDFWNEHPHLVCKVNRRGNPLPQNAQPCDTRAAFVEYVDMLARNESISPALAQRVTL